MPTRRTPDFFIVGAYKCGTSAMYEYLRQHPQIFLPEVKEPQFLSKDIASLHSITSLDEYLSLFSGAGDRKRVGEASASYLYSKCAAREIRQLCPSARIIIMLRNPTDMIYSYHSEFLYNGAENITDFEAALAAEADRRRGRRVPHSPFPPENLLYRQVASFPDQVQRYLDLFDREKIQIIIFDDFKDQTESVYEETLHFLGVDPGFRPSFEVHNPNKRMRSRSLLTFQQFVARHREAIHRLGRHAPSVVRDGFNWFLGRFITRLNTVYEPRPPLNPELRKRLQAEFAPDVEKLSTLLGRDLTHWSRA